MEFQAVFPAKMLAKFFLLNKVPERPPEAAVPLDVRRRLPDAAGAVDPVAVVVGRALQVGAGVARVLRLFREWSSFIPPQCQIFFGKF